MCSANMSTLAFSQPTEHYASHADWPHSFCWFIGEVPPELRQAKTCLQQERCKAKQLNVHRDIDQQVGDHTSSKGEQEYKDTVVTEIGPFPNVVDIKIWDIDQWASIVCAW